VTIFRKLESSFVNGSERGRGHKTYPLDPEVQVVTDLDSNKNENSAIRYAKTDYNLLKTLFSETL
jgi:hypothetical protein